MALLPVSLVWPPPKSIREACSWHSVTWVANCVSLGQLAVQWEGVVRGRLESRGKQSYLHSLSALPCRHTVSDVSEEMKSLIIEKNKMGLEDEPELLVKGKSSSQDTLTPRSLSCIYLLSSVVVNVSINLLVNRKFCWKICYFGKIILWLQTLNCEIFLFYINASWILFWVLDYWFDTLCSMNTSPWSPGNLFTFYSLII